MSSVYSFRCNNKHHSALDSILVIFFAPGAFADEILSEEITKQTAVNLTPDFVAILISDGDRESVDSIGEMNDAFAPLAGRSSVGVYVYDESGDIKHLKSVIGSPSTSVDMAMFARQGLTNLARKRDVVLDSGPTAHFIKPSGEGDRRFLRASLALSDAGEIFFCALCLLPHLGKEISVMHIDTSAISSLALAVSIMKKLPTPMNVKTFASYSGMHAHDFNPDRGEIVVISASQSGNLAAQVKKKIGKHSKVVTLFSAGQEDNIDSVVCNLNFHKSENPRGLHSDHTAKNNFSSSRPIRLIGDQFHAEISPSISVVPGVLCSPKKLQSTIQRLIGGRVFSCFKKPQDGSHRRSIWVNSSALLDSNVCREWINEILLKEVPSQIKDIVFLRGNDISKDFADLLRGDLNKSRLEESKVRAISLDALEDGDLPPVAEKICIVIAGGVTGHGEDLLMASRALRDYAPESHRIFLSLATIPSSNDAHRFLSSNLEIPSHKFKSMFDIVIDRKRSAESWAAEQRLLQNYATPKESTFEERRQELDHPDGLVDNLFWDSKSDPLRLRRNFAFWDRETDCSLASQSDVFLAILAVLENMRSNDKLEPSRRLINSTQAHTVISAGAFTRFNDGIIQASLLRAALAVELNYLHSPQDSGLMAELLCGMLRNPRRPQAEALTEFLISLASVRLRLAKMDLDKVCSCGTDSYDLLADEQKWLLRIIDPAAKEAEEEIPF